MKQSINKLFSCNKIKMFIALILVLFLIYASFFTPYFSAMLIRAVFSTTKQEPLENYEQIAENVTVHNDIEYSSKYGSNTLDVYLPSNGGEPHKTIVFMHGGGYVGGDKNETKYFATSLAASGYAVVSINYARAPETKYPTPLMQLSEVCDFIKTDTTYNLDETNLIFAGSSAGAHAVAQFANIQTSKKYSDLLGIEQTVPAENISVTLLYCGPYNYEIFATQSNGFMNFMMKRSMWAYFGTYNWQEEYGHSATLKYHVTSNFPPTYITDGNIASFERDAKELELALQELNVSVDSYYIDTEHEDASHEFQYEMQTLHGKTVFNQTIDFLDKYAK